jgi:hypothetical protein
VRCSPPRALWSHQSSHAERLPEPERHRDDALERLEHPGVLLVHELVRDFFGRDRHQWWRCADLITETGREFDQGRQPRSVFVDLVQLTATAAGAFQGLRLGRVHSRPKPEDQLPVLQWHADQGPDLPR